jgi:hypothetical protein
MSLSALVLGTLRIFRNYLGDEAADAGINALRAVGTCSRHCVILSVQGEMPRKASSILEVAEVVLGATLCS